MQIRLLLKLGNPLFSFVFFIIIILFLTSESRATVTVSHVFGNGMILQCNSEVSVWGKASTNEPVTIEIAGQEHKIQANSNGKWSVKLSPHAPGGPFVLKISGTNSIIFKDVYFGEVWICAGQSNMGVTLRKVDNAKAELASANYSRIRFLTIPEQCSDTPLDDFQAKWQKCSSKSAVDLSAIAYYFGRNLHETINMPVGLIILVSNGSTCEAWTDRNILLNNSDLKALTSLERDSKISACQRAGYLYNGMLIPICHFTVRGVIWYQGESNTSRAFQYQSLFPLMIKNWRKSFGREEMPFYFVQLPNFMKVKSQPSSSAWAELREAQHKVSLNTANVGEVVTIDTGSSNDLFPQNKEIIGNRLATLALTGIYQNSLPCKGPEYCSYEIQGSQFILTFKNTEKGLKIITTPLCDNSKLSGFAIAGSDRKFYWADAQIEGEKVIVSSPQVTIPVAVRYAWADNPACNLGNSSGLPASPFRTDNWPGVTVKAQ